jgi:hypothetical protein
MFSMAYRVLVSETNNIRGSTGSRSNMCGLEAGGSVSVALIVMVGSGGLAVVVGVSLGVVEVGIGGMRDGCIDGSTGNEIALGMATVAGSSICRSQPAERSKVTNAMTTITRKCSGLCMDHSSIAIRTAAI